MQRTRLFWILWAASVPCACGTSHDRENELEPGAVTPIYVTLFSHNEEGAYWESLINDQEAYRTYRADLVAKVELIAEFGATLNWQGDHSALRAMLENETSDLFAATNGKNVLRWMAEDMGVSIDPHGHLTRYNHADLVYLIEQLGVAPSSVIGGVAVFTCGQELDEIDSLSWHETIDLDADGLIRGWQYPEHTWRPGVLAQPAMTGHARDEFSSGVWAPGDADDFYNHHPDSDIVYVGQGYPHDQRNIGTVNSGGSTILYSDAGYVLELADKISAAELESGQIYTASIHLRDNPVQPGAGATIDGLRATLEALEDLATDGRVLYLDYESVVDVWKTQYASEPNRVGIDQFSIYDDLMDEVRAYCWNDDSGGCGAGDCPLGKVCAPNGETCVPDCRLESTCPFADWSCDQTTGLCGPEQSSEVATLRLTVTNPASGQSWWVKAYYPPDASAQNKYPAVVIVPGGSGAGSTMEGTASVNHDPLLQAPDGFVVVMFDADGRGLTPGDEDDCGFAHQDGLAEVIRSVADLPFVDTAQIALATNSFGITMGSGTLARHPDLPVRFLLDVEGPADRHDTGHCFGSTTGHLDHDCEDDLWWSEREAATFIKDVGVPYLRVQKEVDHAQPDNHHAILMINNATREDAGGEGRSPWTRINEADMNPPNTVYDDISEPHYYALGEGYSLTELWGEMFTLAR